MLVEYTITYHENGVTVAQRIEADTGAPAASARNIAGDKQAAAIDAAKGSPSGAPAAGGVPAAAVSGAVKTKQLPPKIGRNDGSDNPDSGGNSGTSESGSVGGSPGDSEFGSRQVPIIILGTVIVGGRVSSAHARPDAPIS